MANIAITPGTGATVAADTVASVNYQQVKIVDGTIGSTNALFVNADGLLTFVPASQWAVTNVSIAGGTATVTKAATPAKKHYVQSITATVAAGAAAQGPLTVTLTDNATVVWQGTLSAPASSSAVLSSGPINIQAAAVNTAMILAFTGAGAANTLQAVSMTGYDAA